MATRPGCSPQRSRAARSHVTLRLPCASGAAPLYLFVPHAFASGIGSQLRIVANSMMQAVVARRTFVLDDAVAHSTFVDPRIDGVRAVRAAQALLSNPSRARSSTLR